MRVLLILLPFILSSVWVFAAEDGRSELAFTAPPSTHTDSDGFVSTIGSQVFAVAAVSGGNGPPAIPPGNQKMPQASRHDFQPPFIGLRVEGGRRRGIQVLFVHPNLSAAHAGIQKDDIVLKVNGNPVRSAEVFRDLTLNKKPGSIVGLTLLREGTELNVKVLIPQIHVPPFLFVRVLDNEKGAFVLNVAGGTPAAEKSGIRVGDIIQKINGKAIQGAGEIETMTRSLGSEKTLNVSLLRQDEMLEVKLGIMHEPPAIGLRALNDEKGALVFAVANRGPAQNAGIRKDDVIQKINGQGIEDAVQLAKVAQTLPYDSTVPISLLRDGEVLEVKLSINSPPGNQANSEMTEDKGQFITPLFQIGLSGILPILISLSYLLNYLKFKRIHQQMLDTETSAIGSLKPGVVEIQGRVESTLPLVQSPWGQKLGVFYYFHVRERIRSYVRASNGKPARHVTDDLDRVTDRRSDPFQIRDETGVVDIIPGECEFLVDADFSFTWTESTNVAPEHVEHLKTLLKTRYKRKMKLGTSFFKLKFGLPTFDPAVAWLFKEYVLENGDAVYVFGEARQKQGKLVIGGGKTPLIISDKSEAGLEFVFKERAAKYRKIFYIWSITGLVIFLGFLFLAIAPLLLSGLEALGSSTT